MIPKPANAGMPVLGTIFLVLAAFRFLNGDDWVIWAIFAFLFGGFGIFANWSAGGDSSDDKSRGDKA